MPYTNVPQELTDKMDACVKDVQAKDPSKSKESAIAICHTTVVGKEKAAMLDVAYFSMEELYRLSVTEPNQKLRKQYADEYAKAQDVLRKVGQVEKTDWNDPAQSIKSTIEGVLKDYHSRTTAPGGDDWMRVSDGYGQEGFYRFLININHVGEGRGGALAGQDLINLRINLLDALEAYGDVKIRDDGVTMYINVPKPS